MAITASKITDWRPGPGVKCAVYELTLDNSWLAAGEAVDLTADFDYVYAATVSGTEGGLGYAFEMKTPGHDVALSSSNLKLMAYYSADGTDGEVFVAPVDTTDISAAGPVVITVVGID